MFIQTESTPNPRTLKFLPGREVLGQGSREFADSAAAAGSPLALALFAVDGVERVYLGGDFVTVTKAEAIEWPHLKPHLLAAIMDHYTSGQPVLLAGGDDAAGEADITYEGDAAAIVKELKELIEARVRPAVARDGGDITFHSWDHEAGVVRLNMRGSCAGCPSSTMTLKQGIENMLRHYVPEVQAVEQVLD
ncbi:MAG: NifU family protein [Hyphomonadaceae bacterium]|nr:NifU family protein [Hyphomonadaceae bacterium]MBX3510281.1 NifU family protein [Hyphomonadaceae bacterium]